MSWNSIPPGSGISPAQRTAAQANICATATAMVDEYCHQPLRATIDTVTLRGPGVRVGVPRDWRKPVSLIMKRWPILSVVSVQVSPNTFPRTWTTVPAGNYEPASPVIGLYNSVAPGNAGEGSQEILLAPGYVDWRRGRDGYEIEVAHVNGWPHAGLTSAAAPVSSGSQTIAVDDCTGWAVAAPYGGFTGATGTVYDAAAQEVIHVTAASAAQGPGTLTLAAPLQYSHAAGVMVSTLPQTVVWAATLFCASIALTRGATATTMQTIPGGAGSTAGPKGPEDLAGEAELQLNAFRRII